MYDQSGKGGSLWEGPHDGAGEESNQKGAEALWTNSPPHTRTHMHTFCCATPGDKIEEGG